MFYGISVVALGFLLDLLIGDPHWMPHPVRFIGWLITHLEPPIRRIFAKRIDGELIGGTVLTLLVILTSLGISGVVVYGITYFIGGWPAFLLQAFLCSQLLAVKSLRKESMKVFEELKKGDLAGAQEAVSMIVGRDTKELSPVEVAKAAVETIAENASDGVAAPLLYLMVGGIPLGFCYKAINTLDSMIGYRNERYLHFGRFAAKLDDIANFIPSRLCALLMTVSASLCGLDGLGAFRIWKRDRRNHKSPNSAQTEAACAGALGVQLAGDAYYGGKLFKKPTIGDADRPVIPEDIKRANVLMYVTSFLMLLSFSIIKLFGILILY